MHAQIAWSTAQIALGAEPGVASIRRAEALFSRGLTALQRQLKNPKKTPVQKQMVCNLPAACRLPPVLAPVVSPARVPSNNGQADSQRPLPKLLSLSPCMRKLGQLTDRFALRSGR